MYTVLIADDEKELRRAIVRTINWSKIGFHIVGEAENGIEAIELVEQLEPDLLLTDIKMPFVSGIELARRARSVRPVMEIAFLSGYDDFEYAKQAIEYNIISYLLKPLSLAELTKELEHIKRKMDEKFKKIQYMHALSDFNQKKEEYERSLFLLPLFLDMVSFHNSTSEENDKSENCKIEQRAIQLGLRRAIDVHSLYRVLVIQFWEDEKSNCTEEKHIGYVDEIIRKYVCCGSVYSNGKIITVVGDIKRSLDKYTPIFTKEIIQGAERILKQGCEIGISREFESLRNGNTAYAEAVTACEFTFGEGREPRFISDMENNYISKPVDAITMELERLLKTAQEEVLDSFLNRVFEDAQMGHNEFLMMQLMSTIYAVLSSTATQEEVENLLKQMAFSDKLVVRQSYDKIKRSIRDFAFAARNMIANQRKHYSEVICEEAVQIINEEYMDENLKLSSISDRLHVSVSYLSTLIKKEQGESFVSLLTEKRMKVAKEYLLCSSRKILEIANECGYSDHHYFSYCFKKYYGMPPNKMRELVRNV
ncbi:MAG: response regulator [Velocimicrobium sp.]